jgi:crotonobetainyl-CoA:carnitine CoA-transferase CaiB-like acyl-CoA transferase
MCAARPLPLSGIRVLDFGHILAGPFCARLLADLGAEVVKVETATRQGRLGARRGGQRPGNTSGRTALLAHINRNRRSIDLNLKTDRGRDIARRLADKADILVENFSAGVMDRLGLGYPDLSQSNPRIVYASMSAYGHTGPHRDWTGMNVTLQACSGLMLATGDAGDPPIGISNSWNDYIGGLHAATAIVGALSRRNATGRGCHLDVSQFECSVAMIGSLLLASAVQSVAPDRLGSRSSSAAPQGCYRCAGEDQWCAISVRDDGQWQSLVAEIGETAPRLGEPRLATLDGRIAHHVEIDAAIESWTRTRSPAEVERRLTQRGVAAAAMRRGNDIAEVEEWRRVLHPIEGLGAPGTRVVGLPFAFRDCRPAQPVAAPHMGEHGREILRDWLNLDEEVSV